MVYSNYNVIYKIRIKRSAIFIYTKNAEINYTKCALFVKQEAHILGTKNKQKLFT